MNRTRDLVVEARGRLERPYALDHAASIRRKAAKPRDLLGWFLRGIRDEIPERLHRSGVWADAKRRRDAKDYAAVGGSLLGTPGTADQFRAFLEGEPLDETEEARLTVDGATRVDEAYRFPMRAALAALRGRGPSTAPYPFMAALLFRVACMDGDWVAACRTFGLVEPAGGIVVNVALERLWERYAEEPPARPINAPVPIRTEGLAAVV